MEINRKIFFDGFRELIDPTIEQEQVDGLNFLLGEIEKDPFWKFIPQIAYALATVYHETAGSFQPVEEGYYLGDRAAAFQKTLRYYPFFGRGYVQLTWKENYESAGQKLDIPNLVDDPDLAKEPLVAYNVLTFGMHQGWFTGKKLDDYIKGSKKDYTNARKIVNGLDKAGLIAGYARSFEKILNLAVKPVTADPPQVEHKITEVTDTTSGTVAMETTEIVYKGDPPDAPPVKVSRGGPLAGWLAGGGGLTAVGTLMWGFINNNLNAMAVAIICVTLLIIVIIFRGALTDAIRMQISADPDRKNVK